MYGDITINDITSEDIEPNDGGYVHQMLIFYLM